MGGACGDLQDRLPYVYRADRCRCLIVSNVIQVSIAKLPRRGLTPTLDATILESYAGVLLSCTNLSRCEASAYVNRACKVGRLVVSDVLSVSVAKLSRGV